MKILIYGINYAPELTGVGKYTGEMAVWLYEQGHEVSVVTAPPYYPEWKVGHHYSAWSYKHEEMQNISVWRCPLYVPDSPTGLKRIIHLASFSILSFPVMVGKLFWRPDVILSIEPPLFCGPTAWMISRICGAKCWLHIQDFEVDAAFELGILSSARISYKVLQIERWLMNKFDIVSTISSQMITRLDTKSVKPEKQVLFPNWVDTALIYPVKSLNIFREQLGILPTDIVFLYSGNMGEKQGLEIIIEAAQKLKGCKEVVFVMCGHGAAYRYLRSSADGLLNMHWLDLQPLGKLNDLLNMADVHLLPQKAGAEDLVMPSKLTGMLSSGRPVLATANNNTQIAEVLSSSGMIVPPGDTTLFINAILELAESGNLRKKLGESARNYAIEHLGVEAVLSQFEKRLRECVAENTNLRTDGTPK
ncbi:MAG TPA: colanic acid biosynthesis glycosyltransferase WcaI [Gammaproteobacteria bacterium]|nr:colanic acid biosynthesis glycosyltransferase WcaI [Gammaproteobacteria bacterium]